MPSRLSHPRGFSLIELSIVLLIAGLLIAGVFSVTSNMQKQRTDQATANEVRTVVTALERYLVDNQGALTDQTAGNVIPTSLYCNPAPCSKSSQLVLGGLAVKSHQLAGFPDEYTYFQKNYLPGGLDLSSYKIGITNYGPITTSTNTNGGLNLRGLVIRNSINAADDGRLARIASLIGAQGGMIPNTAGATCATSSGGTGNVSGVYGAWCINSPDYSISLASVSAGSIAAYTSSVDSQINTNLLSRINTGNPEANTMETDLLGNNGIGNPASAAAAAETFQNKILNIAGLGVLVTSAKLNDTCYLPPVPIGTKAADLIVYDVTGTTAIGALSLDGSQTTTSYSITPQNMVVFGTSNATTLGSGGTGYANNGSAPTLLQCVNTTASGWIWRPALSQATTFQNFNSSALRVREQIYRNTGSSSRTVNVSNCDNPGLPNTDLWAYIDVNPPPTCGFGNSNVALPSNPSPTSVVVAKISGGSASSFIVPPNYYYYLTNQTGIGHLPFCVASSSPCQWGEYNN